MRGQGLAARPERSTKESEVTRRRLGLLGAVFWMVVSCSPLTERLGAAQTSATSTSSRPSAPGDRVTAFLSRYRALAFHGLPTTAQQQALAPFFSSRLRDLMRDARLGQQAYIRRYPTDKPPLIEGDLFSSLFEGTTGSKIADSQVDGVSAVVRVTYSYVDPVDRTPVQTWTDRFLLVREASGSGWVIDDVEYLGGWDFAPKGKLSDMLRDTAALRSRP